MATATPMRSTATGQLGIKWGADNFNGGTDGHVGGNSAAGFVQDASGRSVTFTNSAIAVAGGTLTSHGDTIVLELSPDKTTLDRQGHAWRRDPHRVRSVAVGRRHRRVPLHPEGFCSIR